MYWDVRAAVPCRREPTPLPYSKWATIASHWWATVDSTRFDGFHLAARRQRHAELGYATGGDPRIAMSDLGWKRSQGASAGRQVLGLSRRSRNRVPWPRERPLRYLLGVLIRLKAGF